MYNYESELNSIEFAGWWMRRLQESMAMAREMAKDDPEGARCLLAPLSELSAEIRATRTLIEDLTEEIEAPVEMPAQSA